MYSNRHLEPEVSNLLRQQFQYIARQGTALAVGVALSNALAVLVPISFNAFKSVEGYGLYSYVMSVLSIVGISSLSGMNSAILVGAAQNKLHILRSATKRRIMFSLLLGCPTLLAAAIIILKWIPQQTPAGYACLILLPVFPFTYSFTGVYPYLNGRRQFWTYAVATIVAAFLNVAAVFVCLWIWPTVALCSVSLPVRKRFKPCSEKWREGCLLRSCCYAA